MKIIIKGFFGQNNIGDEAILDSMLSSLISEKYRTSEIVVFSANPKFTSERYGVKSISSNWVRAFKDTVKEVLGADIFILGGGGLFPNDSPVKILRSVLFFLLLKLLGVKKIIVYSVGVDRIRYTLSKLLISIFFNRFVSAISARDVESAEELKKAGVKGAINVCADAAFLLPSDDSVADKLLNAMTVKPKNYISVVLAKPWNIEREPNQSLRYKKFLNGCISLINDLEKHYKDMHFVFIPFFYPGDVELSRNIIKNFSNSPYIHLVDVHNQPRLAKALIKKSALLIGMRFHSLVFAISTNVPVAAISYGPKSDSLLHECEIDKYSVRLGIRSSEFFKVIKDVDFKEFYYKVVNAWENREVIKEKLRRKAKLVGERVCPIGKIISEFRSTNSS